MKKAQGLPLNTIIIAAIVLIVLVIIVMIFTGRIGVFNTGVQSCVNNGGTCTDPATGCSDSQKQIDYSCGDESTEICCIGI